MDKLAAGLFTVLRITLWPNIPHQRSCRVSRSSAVTRARAREWPQRWIVRSDWLSGALATGQLDHTRLPRHITRGAKNVMP